MNTPPVPDPPADASGNFRGVSKEQLFEAILGSTPDLAYIFDLDHRFIYANAALLAMWGKTWEEAEGKNCLELGYEPWHAEMHDREIEQVVRTGKPIRGDVPFNGQAGRRIYDYIFNPVRSADGKIIAVAGTTRDVTERKQEEEKSAFLSELSRKLALCSDRDHAANEAVEMLGKFLDGSRCLFGEGNRNDNRVVIESDWVADGVTSIRGEYELFQFGDMEWWDAYSKGDYTVEDVSTHAQTRNQAEAYLKMGVRSYAAQTETVGSDRVLLLSVNSATPRVWTPRELGIIADVLACLSPVVERFRAKQKLEVQNQKMGILWDAAQILLTSDDPESMLQQIFDAISGPLGLDVYINYMNDGDRLRLSSFRGIGQEEAESLRTLEFGQAICGTVALTRRAIIAGKIERSDDPKTQAVKCLGLKAYICNPLIAGEEILGTLSFGSRTKSSFSVEEAQFIETITRYVTASYVRMRLVNDLRESDRKKDQFLATLAHELRNPISPILTGLEVIRLSSGDPGKIEKVSGMIRDQTRQMVHLIDDLLELSRISTGKIVLRRSQNDICAIIRDAIDIAEPASEQKNQKIIYSRPNSALKIDCDPHRVSQVISNLLGNAIKYTQHGGEIHVSVEGQDDTVRMVVSDNGIGIEPSSQQRVFSMFEQEDTDRQDGLGIGLTLVRNLTQLHGGDVSLHSDGKGLGTRVSVSLPRGNSAPMPRTVTADSWDNQSEARQRDILVVDDERAAADMLKLLLDSPQLAVDVAYDGAEAVDKVRKSGPEIVFLDLGMPRMDGFEAARAIREIRPDTLLVAVSGWGRSEDRERTAASGFVRHLVKPVAPADIWRVLKELSS
ncbi:ATP-binding protein [Luteolibacter sp. SL250]|uniref:ATP-binding protein n=1 Tax=Luteolibacter sp. SL250 TaxID=2995170 RepID=UPI00226FD980|nr:ATP-binding protein [Luteolibacter sp. SL250]WAC19091.1 ATP-binding protein [Luteolibacter sp. SL250]